MIVDVHTHAFPYLGGASGYDDVSTHLRYLQNLAHVSTHMFTKGERPLLNEDVDLRVGRYGKLEWIKDGDECFIQWMPPVVADMEWPPEHAIAHMDWIGVEKAVIYQGHVYGRLNDYVAECVKRWPRRLAGVAQIDEVRGCEEGELDELKRAVSKLGLKGLYYEVPRKVRIDDERFNPLWEEVMRLRIPIVWDIVRRQTAREYLDVLRMVENIMRRFPDMKGLLSMIGSNMRSPSDPQYVRTPEELYGLLELPNVSLEIPYLLGFHLFDEYPYKSCQRIIEAIYREIGERSIEKIVWGSDMPALMRACTYRQCLDFVRLHCPFFSEEEKRMVLGENAIDLFGL